MSTVTLTPKAIASRAVALAVQASVPAYVVLLDHHDRAHNTQSAFAERPQARDGAMALGVLSRLLEDTGFEEVAPAAARQAISLLRSIADSLTILADTDPQISYALPVLAADDARARFADPRLQRWLERQPDTAPPAPLRFDELRAQIVAGTLFGSVSVFSGFAEDEARLSEEPLSSIVAELTRLDLANGAMQRPSASALARRATGAR